jgi:hypothetical protein
VWTGYLGGFSDGQGHSQVGLVKRLSQWMRSFLN